MKKIFATTLALLVFTSSVANSNWTENTAAGGQTTYSGGIDTSTPPVQLPHVGSDLAVPSCNFTRPGDTTAYAVGDLVANSTTAGSVVPCTVTVSRGIDLPVILTRMRVAKSGTSVTNASFRVHLYRSTITFANGDNGAWSTTVSNYVGCFDVTVDKAFTDGAKGTGTPCIGNFIMAHPVSGAQTLLLVVEARAAYTPGNAEVFTLTPELFQN